MDDVHALEISIIGTINTKMFVGVIHMYYSIHTICARPKKESIVLRTNR